MNAGLSKQELRRIALARRDELSPETRVEHSLSLCDHVPEMQLSVAGQMVAGFLPIRSEIDPRPLLQKLREQGARLCLPVVIDPERIEFRQLLPDSRLVPSGFGTVGPDADNPVVDPDILLMPLAGFDETGNRIGYGAGHYDRAIAGLFRRGLRPQLIGLAFSVQEVTHFFADAHDVPLHGVLTEKGFRWFRGPQEGNTA